MVCIKPTRYLSQNSSGSILKILTLGANDSTRRLFAAFPGPLIRGVTHKKTVIEFCQDQIRYGPPSNVVRSRGNSVSSIHSAMGQANKSSFVLMWNLLILLLRQNGVSDFFKRSTIIFCKICAFLFLRWLLELIYQNSY